MQYTTNQQLIPQHLILKGKIPSNSLEHSIKFPPSHTFGLMLESSCLLSVQERMKLRYIWQTKYMVDNMTIRKRASTLYSKKIRWFDHTLPDGYNCSWDMSCKSRLHPSSRTMDVARLNNSDTLPLIATIGQGGWGMFRSPENTEREQERERQRQFPPREHARSHQRRHEYRRDGDDTIHTLRCPPVHAIRVHEGTSRCGTVVRDPHLEYTFQLFPLPNATTHVEVQLPVPVHDFCFGKDLAIFACPRYHANNDISPIFMPLESMRGSRLLASHNLRMLNVQNFPQSDTLRVEMTCDHDKYVAFGHRNGQVSLLDLRASQPVCSIYQYEQSSSSTTSTTPLGSVSDMGFLSSSLDSKQIIVRRSFGSCQVHDIRKASSTSMSATTALHNLVVPSDDINPTLSANCNGFVVDPIGKQTLISPYINSNNDAHLGVWSLRTGRMVDSRLLQSSSTSSTVEQDILYVELCNKTTPSFAPSTSNREKVASSSSFAAWLKCGAFTKDKITSSKVGSLTQLTFPGHWQY